MILKVEERQKTLSMEKSIHEGCGVAMIRLLKPPEYYQEKYGTWMYTLNKLHLMMEKQHNHGQEGVGMASVKLDSESGNEYMLRERTEGKNTVAEIFANVHKHCKNLLQEQLSDVSFAKTNLSSAGDPYTGRLRRSTTGKGDLSYVHSFLRRNNWKAGSPCMCGNFNMTNIGDIFETLTEQGQCPHIYGDMNILLESIGRRLDREVERNFVDAQKLGLEKCAITSYIEENVQMSDAPRTTTQYFDDGYIIYRLTGSDEIFSIRNPQSVHPAFYYKSDEIVVLASERPVLRTTLDPECGDIQRLKPGQTLIANKRGECSLQQILEPEQNAVRSLERVYSSRGLDRDIYKGRETLGHQLTEPVLKAVSYDAEHTVLLYIPNTMEAVFYGPVYGLREQINEKKVEQIAASGSNTFSEGVYRIIHQDIRSEKVAWKDTRLRTSITEGNSCNDLASHVHDVTYECIKPYEDNSVTIDDSIVRRTTLEESILHIPDHLHPKEVVVVSSAPQIRFPDYCGIDMLHPEEFHIFRAVIELIRERGTEDLPREVYKNCKKELTRPKGETTSNAVHAVHRPFTMDEINKRIVEMLRPKDMTTPVELVFQSVEGLHNTIPNYPGDWYFTGNYPIPGGM